jgi:hypothetical protein
MDFIGPASSGGAPTHKEVVMLGKIMTALLLAGVTAGSVQAAAPADRFNPPAGATVLVDGTSATLTGRLEVKDVAGRPAAFLKLTSPAVERHTLFYPAVFRPGIGGPRPPFAYVPVSVVRLTAQDRNLVHLAQLVGTQTAVRLTGTYGYFSRHRINQEERGLAVATATLRNSTISAELPSLQRLMALARAAVVQQLQRRPNTLVEGQPQAYDQGGLQVKVLVYVRERVSGRRSHLAYLYDFLTGAVRPAAIAVAQAR